MKQIGWWGDGGGKGKNSKLHPHEPTLLEVKSIWKNLPD